MTYTNFLHWLLIIGNIYSIYICEGTRRGYLRMLEECKVMFDRYDTMVLSIEMTDKSMRAQDMEEIQLLLNHRLHRDIILKSPKERSAEGCTEKIDECL